MSQELAGGGVHRVYLCPQKSIVWRQILSNAVKPKQKLSPARAISGFPEFLPEIRCVEQQWLDAIRGVFESYGYASVETRSVEEVESLASKGADVDKEIYGLHRLAAPEAGGSEPKMALHFDMTVPFARYVAQNYNELVFPFKRYQMQKAWRGERPQEGRFREFTQCDIDVIDRDNISIHFDAEMPVVMAKALEAMDVGMVEMRVNNRKLLQGFYEGVGIENPNAAIRIVDKLDKVGPENVKKLLVSELNIDESIAASCLKLATIKTSDLSFERDVRALGVSNPLLDQGISELKEVMASILASPTANCKSYADLSIARGLDYYTGTVYEVKFSEWPDYPTICGGGRYENLAGSFINQKLPGVGVSIGLTRIFTKLVKEKRITVGPKSPTEVLVAYLPGNTKSVVLEAGNRLRNRGLSVEAYHESAKLDKQLRYASKKGVSYVWFVGGEANDVHEVKDMETGIQIKADPDVWIPTRRKNVSTTKLKNEPKL